MARSELLALTSRWFATKGINGTPGGYLISPTKGSSFWECYAAKWGDKGKHVHTCLDFTPAFIL
jgi:hypothetical protein